MPAGLVNSWTVGAFNEFWYRKSRVSHRGAIQDIGLFFHPLDLVDEWNRVYGRRGFVQYQFVVPFGQENTVRQVIETLSNENLPSFLAVLKRFGAENPGMLSFPMPGWTLAVDIPVSKPTLGAPSTASTRWCSRPAGACISPRTRALDPRISSACTPNLPEWRAVRDRVDPDHRITSDLSRRLGL